MTNPAAAPVRGSWWRLAIGLAAFAILPVMPHMRAILPIEQTLMLLAAALAACALVAWRNGGRFLLALTWVVIAAILLASPVGPAESAYSWMAKGWTLLVAASFGIATVVVTGETFLSRALASLAVATSIAFALVLLSPGGPARVSNAMAAEFNRRNDQSIAAFRQVSEQPEWRQAAKESPSLQRLFDDSESMLAAIPRWSTIIMPAVLALESLAALALGWALFHRMSPVGLGPPLGRLRDFRFNDHLVWGVAVGASVFLLQAFAEGKNAGLNLLVFFGFLYVLRGLGVLAWMSRTRAMTFMLVMLALFVFPLFGALALGLGLGDTWLDLRSRVSAKP